MFVQIENGNSVMLKIAGRSKNTLTICVTSCKLTQKPRAVSKWYIASRYVQDVCRIWLDTSRASKARFNS